MSTFKTKNLYHLRISANSVLPLYVKVANAHPRIALICRPSRCISIRDTSTGCPITSSSVCFLTCSHCTPPLGIEEGLLVYSVRCSIIPKLIEEAHAYLGPGSGPQGAKKPTVSVHRGGAYSRPLLNRRTVTHYGIRDLSFLLFLQEDRTVFASHQGIIGVLRDLCRC